MSGLVQIVPNSDVIFDWDNTLKKIEKNPNGGPPRLYTSVPENVLHQLISEMNCRLFVLTSISNTSLGCQTLKMEIEGLGLKQFFLLPGQSDECVKQETAGGSFWHWGNSITCGLTPKADVYLYCCRQNGDKDRQVYFFDDEINNVQYFEMVLPKSTVCHISNEVPIVLSQC